MTGFFISESMNKLAFIQSTHFVSCFLVIESNFVFDLFELFNVTLNDMGIFMTVVARYFLFK